MPNFDNDIATRSLPDLLEQIKRVNMLRGPLFKNMSQEERHKIFKFPSIAIEQFKLFCEEQSYLFTVKLNEDADAFGKSLAKQYAPDVILNTDNKTLELQFDKNSVSKFKNFMGALNENYDAFQQIKSRFLAEALSAIDANELQFKRSLFAKLRSFVFAPRNPKKVVLLANMDLTKEDRFLFDSSPPKSMLDENAEEFLNDTATTHITRKFKNGKPYFVYTATNEASEERNRIDDPILLSKAVETDAIIQDTLSQICPHFAKVVYVDNPECLNYYVTEGGTALRKYITNGPHSTTKDLDIIYQITEGLYEMHYYGMFHGQINPSKLSITPKSEDPEYPEGKVLIGEIKPCHVDSTSAALEHSYRAPDKLMMIEPIPYSFEDDVYSLGIMINEILAKKNPFYEQAQAYHHDHDALYTPQIIRLMFETSGTARPALFSSEYSVLSFIIEGCWRMNPQDRFTMETVLQCLKQVKACNNDESKMSELFKKLQEEHKDFERTVLERAKMESIIKSNKEKLNKPPLFPKQLTPQKQSDYMSRINVRRDHSFNKATFADAKDRLVPYGRDRDENKKYRQGCKRIDEASGNKALLEEAHNKFNQLSYSLETKQALEARLIATVIKLCDRNEFHDAFVQAYQSISTKQPAHLTIFSSTAVFFSTKEPSANEFFTNLYSDKPVSAVILEHRTSDPVLIEALKSVFGEKILQWISTVSNETLKEKMEELPQNNMTTPVP